jgi:hypothetical protein
VSTNTVDELGSVRQGQSNNLYAEECKTIHTVSQPCFLNSQPVNGTQFCQALFANSHASPSSNILSNKLVAATVSILEALVKVGHLKVPIIVLKPLSPFKGIVGVACQDWKNALFNPLLQPSAPQFDVIADTSCLSYLAISSS